MSWHKQSEQHSLASRGVKTKTDKLKQLSQEMSNLIREIENNPTYRAWQSKNWDDLVSGYKDYKSDFQNSDEHPKPFNEWAMLRFGLFAQGINIDENTTNKQLIYGDFDNDGVRNIDDANPLNSKKTGMVADFPLSKDLSDIEEQANSHKAALDLVTDEIQGHGYKTTSRIKGLQSIINKLKRKHLNSIRDFAGMIIFVKDQADAKRVGAYLNKKFKIIKTEDFYKNPGLNNYKAIHYDVEVLGRPVEIQVKTKAEFDKADKMHSAYKQGKFGEKTNPKVTTNDT